MNDFFDSLRKNSEDLEHRANLKGLTRVNCPKCEGSGEKEPGYVDYDSYGSQWVSSVTCSYCIYGTVEVPCGPAKEIAAVDREIAKLKERRDALERKA